MASSSGNSSGSTSLLLQNSGSEGDLQVLDQRKRKRMESNRESARRSRMRKQKHLDDLMAQVTQMRKENNQILSSINITTQHFLNAEAENSVLRAQMMELGQRLDSLNEILNYINSNNNTTSNYGGFETDHGHYQQDAVVQAAAAADCFMNSLLNPVYLNQPLMASPDLFQY